MVRSSILYADMRFAYFTAEKNALRTAFVLYVMYSSDSV